MKPISLLILLFVANNLYAQIQKGNLLYGGTFGFSNIRSDETKLLNIYVMPTIGKFLSNNFAMGAIIDVNLLFEKEQTVSSYGVSPFARAYFNKSGTARFFGQMQAGIQFLKADFFPSTTALSFGLSIGGDFMLNEFVAIEGSLRYRRSESLESQSYGNLNSDTFVLNFGVIAFIDRPKPGQ